MAVSTLPGKVTPLSLKPLKLHTRVRKLGISPLGYDGKLPVIKTSAWSKRPARMTGIGENISLPTASVKIDVAGPSKTMWSGRLLDGAKASWAQEGMLKKRLFASQKIPRSWVLPGFQSTW